MTYKWLIAIIMAPIIALADSDIKITNQTYDGNMGGHFGVTEKCQQEYRRYRMCSIEEVAISTKVPNNFSSEAWALAPSFYCSGAGSLIDICSMPVANGNCKGWTSNAAVHLGQVVFNNGNASIVPKACNGFKPIACCRGDE